VLILTHMDPDGATMSLYEHALADEILAEVARQRLTSRRVQELSGVKARSWANYLTTRNRHMPVSVVEFICRALKVKPSEMHRRAEERAAHLESQPDPEAVAADALSQLSPEAQAEIAKVSKNLRPKREDPPAKLGREA
jgi:hypothetical protein